LTDSQKREVARGTLPAVSTLQRTHANKKRKSYLAINKNHPMHEKMQERDDGAGDDEEDKDRDAKDPGNEDDADDDDDTSIVILKKKKQKNDLLPHALKKLKTSVPSLRLLKSKAKEEVEALKMSLLTELTDPFLSHVAYAIKQKKDSLPFPTASPSIEKVPTPPCGHIISYGAEDYHVLTPPDFPQVWDEVWEAFYVFWNKKNIMSIVKLAASHGPRSRGAMQHDRKKPNNKRNKKKR
jgi:hypothetical protein